MFSKFFLLAALMSLAVVIVAALVAANGTFELDRAIRGVYWSKIAYCEASNIKTWSCGACPKFPGVTNVTVTEDESHASQGFVGFDGARNEIVYAFRGTVNLVGWIEDFDFPMIPFEPGSGCDGCLVHEGLYKGYLSLAKVLLPKLQQLVHEHPTADILCVGHSMGAGQVTFAFPDVLRKIVGSKGVKRAYSFGQPRIVNSAFARWADSLRDLSPSDRARSEHFYSCNRADPICLIAPRKLMKELFHDQFIHQPQEVFYPKGGHYPPQNNYRLCNGTYVQEDPTCAAQMNFITAMLEGPGFYQHTTYLDIGLGCFLGDEKKMASYDEKRMDKVMINMRNKYKF